MRREATSLTIGGVILFVVGILVLFSSGIRSFRPDIMGLKLHLYLIPIGLAFPFLVISRAEIVPDSHAGSNFGVCEYFTAFSVFNGGVNSTAISEIAKLVLSVLGTYSAALLVTRRLRPCGSHLWRSTLPWRFWLSAELSTKA